MADLERLERPDVQNTRDYNSGFANGFSAGRRNGIAMADAELARLRTEIAGLKRDLKDLIPPPDQRAKLQVVLPGRSETANLLWPHDCNEADLELIRDQSRIVMDRWIKAKTA